MFDFPSELSETDIVLVYLKSAEFYISLPYKGAAISSSGSVSSYLDVIYLYNSEKILIENRVQEGSVSSIPEGTTFSFRAVVLKAYKGARLRSNISYDELRRGFN